MGPKVGASLRRGDVMLTTRLPPAARPPPARVRGGVVAALAAVLVCFATALALGEIFERKGEPRVTLGRLAWSGRAIRESVIHLVEAAAAVPAVRARWKASEVAAAAAAAAAGLSRPTEKAGHRGWSVEGGGGNPGKGGKGGWRGKGKGEGVEVTDVETSNEGEGEGEGGGEGGGERRPRHRSRHRARADDI